MDDKSNILTVSQLTFAIKNQLESRFSKLTLSGEISNFKPHSSGHYYFDLKDGQAKISAVFFRGSQKGLVRMPKEGDSVFVTGALSVYPPHGKYQIVVQKMEFAGVGELLLRLERLKRALHQKGYFAHEHKKPLPPSPRTIGVITSPTGSVIRDIIHVLRRRFSGFHLILNPVRVQGEMAAAEIAQAIRQFNEHKLADVLIVGRGGGSLEDLWPFNEEIVADAIFESALPIISAVGHETDNTIADFVADVRAPTPSAAAEIVLKERTALVEKLGGFAKVAAQTLQHKLRREKVRLERFSHHPFMISPYPLLSRSMQQLDEVAKSAKQLIFQHLMERRLTLKARQKQAMALNPISQIGHSKTRLAQLQSQLNIVTQNRFVYQQQALKKVVGQLQALDPKNVLRRGYSILFSQKSGSVIVSHKQLKPAMKLDVQLADGKAQVVVE